MANSDADHHGHQQRQRDADGVEILDPLSNGLNYLSDDAGNAYHPASGIWYVGRLPVSAAATLTISAEVLRSGNILNLATLTGADLYDPDRSNNSAAILLNGATQSDLALALTSDDLTPEAGDTLTVALTVTNNGVDDATGVRIEALLPVNLSYVSDAASSGGYDQNNGIWDVGNLASGAGAELLLTLTSAAADETVLTAALIAGEQSDPDPTNNRASIVINRDPGDHQVIADMAVHKRANLSAVDVGGQAVFTLLVRNNGPDDAGNIEIADLLPDGLELQSTSSSQGTYVDQSKRWQVGIIPAGAPAVMDMIVDVTRAGAQDNTANIVSLDAFDPDNANDSDTVSVTGLAADIDVTQTVEHTSVNVEENTEFTITVTNFGPDHAVGVQLLNMLPTGLSHQSSVASQGVYDPETGIWEIGSLSNGASVTLQVTAAVEQSGELTSTATITASNPADLNADNNAVEASVTGFAPPGVSDIPDQTIDEGDLFIAVNLDDYVNDADNDNADLDWTYSGAAELSVDIDATTRVAVITIPDPDWYGSETITFIATDPAKLTGSDPAVFAVRNVNDAPVAEVDTYEVDEDTALTVQSPGVLGNDSDVDSVQVSAVLVEDVKSGTLTLSSDGSFSYEPNGDFYGSDTFSYKSHDGLDHSSEVTVTIVVDPVNDAPIANAGGPYDSVEGTSITFDASPSGDIDHDGLRYRWDFNSDGLWDTEYTTEPTATYTWQDEISGTVTVEVSDGALTNTATAGVTVSDVSPAVTISGPDSVDEGAAYSLSMSAVDPGDDTIASWTVNWGDGADETITGNPSAAAHTYADDGNYTISARATNEDGTYDAGLRGGGRCNGHLSEDYALD